MKKDSKLPQEIMQLFDVAKSLVPNATASVRPALLNTLLMNHHPASCRAQNKAEITTNPNLAV